MTGSGPSASRSLTSAPVTAEFASPLQAMEAPASPFRGLGCVWPTWRALRYIIAEMANLITLALLLLLFVLVCIAYQPYSYSPFINVALLLLVFVCVCIDTI